MSGWIKLYRATLEDPIISKDSDYLAVWVLIYLEATHKEFKKIFKGKSILLQPGQLIIGRLQISTRLKVSESKVQRVLKCFESEHLIEQQTSNQNRLITILSWADDQLSEQPFEQQMNNQRTTDEQRVNTLQEGKESKDTKNKRDFIFDVNTDKIQTELNTLIETYGLTEEFNILHRNQIAACLNKLDFTNNLKNFINRFNGMYEKQTANKLNLVGWRKFLGDPKKDCLDGAWAEDGWNSEPPKKEYISTAK